MLGTRDPDTNMLMLERTETFEVIPLQIVLRNIHLIPYFDTSTSAKDTLKAKRDIYNFDKYLLNHFSDKYAYCTFGEHQ